MSKRGWGRALGASEAWKEVEDYLGQSYSPESYGFTPLEGDRRVVSTYGPKGPRHFEAGYDPVTGMFYSSGQGFMPSASGAPMERTPSGALAGFTSRLIEGVQSELPSLMEPYAYNRSAIAPGQGAWGFTGGQTSPEWAAWQRAQQFMGASRTDPTHSTPWMYTQRASEMPEAYPSVSGLVRQASGVHYGPLLTDAGAFQHIPGMSIEGSGADTNLVSAYGGIKPREKIMANLSPGRTYDIWGEDMVASKLRGLEDIQDAFGNSLALRGPERQIEFAPGLLTPGAGQSQALSGAFQNLQLSQGKVWSQTLDYGDLAKWAQNSGMPAITMDSGRVGMQQSPDAQFMTVMGLQQGAKPQHVYEGITGIAPAGANLQLPLGPGLYDLMQQTAPDMLSALRSAGMDTDFLQKVPGSRAETNQYLSMLSVVDANQGLSNRLAGQGVNVEFIPGGSNAKPTLTTGYQVFSEYETGQALAGQGVKSVMQMQQNLTSMGADANTALVIAGESAKGSPMLVEMLANTLQPQDWRMFGVGAERFDESGNMRWGGSQDVPQAITRMLGSQRALFEQVLSQRGGGVREGWWDAPQDPSITGMFQAGGAFYSRTQGSDAQWRFTESGRLQQRIESIYGRGPVIPTEAPSRDRAAGFNFGDILDMTRNSPAVANALYQNAVSSAMPYAQMIMAANRVLPDSAQLTGAPIGPGGLALPIVEARALAAKEFEGTMWAEKYGPTGTEEPPLKFMLQAMQGHEYFRDKFTPIASESGELGFLPPPSAMLQTMSFDMFGKPVDPLGWKTQGLLNAMGGGTERTEPAFQAYQRALQEYANQQGVIRGATTGSAVSGSVSGRLTYVGDMGLKEGQFGVTVSDTVYSRMQKELGADKSGEEMFGLLKRWPNVFSAQSSMVGSVYSASQAAEMQKAAGGTPIDPAKFRVVGVNVGGTTASTEMFDADRDTGAVFAQVASAFPGLDFSSAQRQAVLRNVENVYPQAITSALESLRGLGVENPQISDLSMGAILSHAGSTAGEFGKGLEAVEPALQFPTLSAWWSAKGEAGGVTPLSDIQQQRAADALGKGMTGMVTNFSDLMGFYTSEYEGRLPESERGAYRDMTSKSMDELGRIKQSLVDRSTLPGDVSSVSEKPFEALSSASSMLLSPMTASMWTRVGFKEGQGWKGGRAGDITVSQFGSFQERDDRIYPSRFGIQETELFTGFARSAIRFGGMSAEGIAPLLGGMERMPSEYSEYLIREQMISEGKDVESKSPVVGDMAEFRSWFRKTPLGGFIYGQNAFKGMNYAKDVEERLQTDPINVKPWEAERAKQIRGSLESGEWDAEGRQFMRGMATLGPGGRARILRGGDEEFSGLRRFSGGEQWLGALAAQVREGEGMTAEALGQTPLGTIEQDLPNISEMMKGTAAKAPVAYTEDYDAYVAGEATSYRRDYSETSASGTNIDPQRLRASIENSSLKREVLASRTGVVTGRQRAAAQAIGQEVAQREVSAKDVGSVSAGESLPWNDTERDVQFSSARTPNATVADGQSWKNVNWTTAAPILGAAIGGQDLSRDQLEAWRASGALSTGMRTSDLQQLSQTVQSGEALPSGLYNKLESVAFQRTGGVQGRDDVQALRGQVNQLLSDLGMRTSSRGSAANYSADQREAIAGVFMGGTASLGATNQALLEAGIPDSKLGGIDRAAMALQRVEGRGGVGTVSEKIAMMPFAGMFADSEEGTMGNQVSQRISGLLDGGQWFDKVPKLSEQGSFEMGVQALRTGAIRGGQGGEIGGLPMFSDNLKEASKQIKDFTEITKEKISLDTQELKILTEKRSVASLSGGSALDAFASDYGISRAEAQQHPAYQRELAVRQSKVQGQEALLHGMVADASQPLDEEPSGFFGKAGAGLGKLFKGESRVSFFDLMYLQRVAGITWGGMQQAGEEAEQADWGLAQQFNRGGAGMDAPQSIQRANQQQMTQRDLGRGFNAAYGPVMSAVTGAQGVLGNLPALAGPTVGAGLMASFVNEKFLEGAIPHAGIVGGGLALAAGIGGLAYSASQEPERLGGRMGRQSAGGINNVGDWLGAMGTGAEMMLGYVWASASGQQDEYIASTGAQGALTKTALQPGGINMGGFRAATTSAQLFGVSKEMGTAAMGLHPEVGLNEQAWQQIMGGLSTSFGGDVDVESDFVKGLGEYYAATGQNPEGVAKQQFEIREGRPWREGDSLDLWKQVGTSGIKYDEQNARFGAAYNDTRRSVGLRGTQTPMDLTRDQLPLWQGMAQAYIGAGVSGYMTDEEVQQQIANMPTSGMTAMGVGRQQREIGEYSQIYQALGSWGVQQFNQAVGATGVQGLQLDRLRQQFAAGNPISQSMVAQQTGDTLFDSYDFASQGANFKFGGAAQGQSSQTWADRFGLEGGLRDAWTGDWQVQGTNLNLGGMAGMRAWTQQESFNNQRAQLGTSYAAAAETKTYTQAMWGLQDQMTTLSRGQEDWSFAMQGRRMDLQSQQFYQGQAFAQEQFQVQGQWTQEQIGTSQGRAQMQQGWMRQDWATSDDLRATQWGWALEDMESNIRSSSGRDRRQAIQQRDRATILHGAEEESIDKDRDRAEQKIAWQEEDFRLAMEHHEQSMEWGQERFDMERKNFEDNKKLTEEERAQDREYTLEKRKLEDQMRDLEREHWLAQDKFQRASLSMQAEQIKNAEMLWKAELQASEVERKRVATINELGAGFWADATAGAKSFEAQIKRMFNIDQGGTGASAEGQPTTKRQWGGPVHSGQPVQVGEQGVEVFMPDSSGIILGNHQIGIPMAATQGGGATGELAKALGGLEAGTNAILVIRAINELVHTLDEVSPDRMQRVNNLLKVVTT